MNSDTIVISWNKATLQSLSNQIELANDSSVMEVYNNRLQAFKAFVGIDSENAINASSIRYKFVSELVKIANNRRDFYIVEANRSGEKVEIRNYVMYLDSAGLADVDVYNYYNDGWVKNATSKKINLHLDSNLKSYVTTFGLGFNQDDVIITQFVNYTVKTSEYYIYTTLSDASNIKQILSLK